MKALWMLFIAIVLAVAPAARAEVDPAVLKADRLPHLSRGTAVQPQRAGCSRSGQTRSAQFHETTPGNLPVFW